MSAAEKGATGGGDNPPSAPGSTAPSQRVRPSPKYEVKGTSCGVACLKYLLFVVNVIVWILGLAVVVVAGLTLASGKTSDASLTGVQSVQQAAGTAMFLGCLLLIVGFLGCCGAIKESYLLLAAYFAVLLVILVFEIVAIALAFSFVNSSSMEQSLNDHFVDVISGGRREKEPWKQEEDLNVIYFVQGQLRCCGGKGPEDYAERHLPIPPSCYDNYDTQRTYIYQRGCVAALKEYVRKNGLSIGLVNMFGVFAEIAAMVGACMLMQHFKSAKKAGKNTTQA